MCKNNTLTPCFSEQKIICYQHPDSSSSERSNLMKKVKTIPFNFVIEELDRLKPAVKPMFGCHAIYVRNKIVLILRRKEEGQADNGVWMATTGEHHESLKKEFPSMRGIKIFGSESGWQVLPEDADDFEESVIRACELILRNDARIGKIPKPRARKKTGI
jgi:hypothetical protein